LPKERPKRHFHGTGVGTRDDANAIRGGQAENGAAAVEDLDKLSPGDTRTMRTGKSGSG
jgi:hypothetical protein